MKNGFAIKPIVIFEHMIRWQLMVFINIFNKLSKDWLAFINFQRHLNPLSTCL